jgi:hypothetical protein
MAMATRTPAPTKSHVMEVVGVGFGFGVPLGVPEPDGVMGFPPESTRPAAMLNENGDVPGVASPGNNCRSD